MDTSILVVSQDIIVVAKTFEILAGKSKEEAMSDYITKVKQLQEEAAAS
jgi:diazepam-binding inhibitor (GABA receptor modulating acyl-CoA-binding protein)